MLSHLGWRKGIRRTGLGVGVGVVVGFVVGVASLTLVGVTAAGAGTNGGSARLTNGAGTTNLTPGTQYDRDTPFSLRLPTVPGPAGPGPSVCSGDSANDSYRVTSYIVPASVDPATLSFDTAGPITPAGEQTRYPLYDNTGSPYVNINTAPNTGAVPDPPPFLFGGVNGFSTLELPPGDYNLGIACNLGTVEDKYFNAQMRITAAGSDGGFTYAVGGVAVPTA